MFGGWGDHERGWDQLGPRYDRAAARFARGEVSFEELARHVTPDLASTVHIERSWVWLTGAAQPASMTLRVTHLFRREATGWALLHRHADRLASTQFPDSAGQR
ncbi:MAG: nuclear transport factor 2 family protein [Chloroflexota bacterium]|nr:nuclear transport factor 2 family protein [Chloroflexota bacterium]